MTDAGAMIACVLGSAFRRGTLRRRARRGRRRSPPGAVSHRVVADGAAHLPRDVFLTFAVFFAALGVVVASGLPAASALSRCFLVAIYASPSILRRSRLGRRRGVNDHDRAKCHSVAHALPSVHLKAYSTGSAGAISGPCARARRLHARDHRTLVQGRTRLRAVGADVRRLERRRDRRLQGPHRPARLPRRARRHDALAAPVPTLARGGTTATT